MVNLFIQFLGAAIVSHGNRWEILADEADQLTKILNLHYTKKPEVNIIEGKVSLAWDIRNATQAYVVEEFLKDPPLGLLEIDFQFTLLTNSGIDLSNEQRTKLINTIITRIEKRTEIIIQRKTNYINTAIETFKFIHNLMTHKAINLSEEQKERIITTGIHITETLSLGILARDNFLEMLFADKNIKLTEEQKNNLITIATQQIDYDLLKKLLTNKELGFTEEQKNDFIITALGTAKTLITRDKDSWDIFNVILLFTEFLTGKDIQLTKQQKNILITTAIEIAEITTNNKAKKDLLKMLSDKDIELTEEQLRRIESAVS